jgi:hypothetical protein
VEADILIFVVAATVRQRGKEKDRCVTERERRWGLKVNVLWYKAKAYALKIHTP